MNNTNNTWIIPIIPENLQPQSHTQKTNQENPHTIKPLYLYPPNIQSPDHPTYIETEKIQIRLNLLILFHNDKPYIFPNIHIMIIHTSCGVSITDTLPAHSESSGIQWLQQSAELQDSGDLPVSVAISVFRVHFLQFSYFHP